MSSLKGAATPEQIAKWKEEHGKVYNYTVDGMICYLRPVDRNIHALAASKVSTSPAKYNETIIEQSWLGGCEDIRKKDNYYFGLADHVDTLMDKKMGELGEC